MPCSSDGYPVVDYKKELDHVTDMLCRVCTMLESEGINLGAMAIHSDIDLWWRNHKEADSRRRKAEKQRAEEQLKKKKATIRQLQNEIEKLEKDLK